MSTTYRTKLAVYLENDIYDWVKAKTANTGIPQSRLIEKALKSVYGKEIEEFIKEEGQSK